MILPYDIRNNIVWSDMQTADTLMDSVASGRKPMQLICSAVRLRQDDDREAATSGSTASCPRLNCTAACPRYQRCQRPASPVCRPRC